MTRQTTRKTLATMALVLGLAGVAAPAANAMIAVDPPGVPAGAIAPHPVRPDDRSGVRGPGSVASTATPTEAASSGFSWTDAGIGFAAALGVTLVAGGGVLLSRHGRPGNLASHTRETSTR